MVSIKFLFLITIALLSAFTSSGIASAELTSESLGVLEMQMLGQKNVDAPSGEHRLEHLEQETGQYRTKDESTEYRVNQLYQAQSVKVSIQNQQLAIRAYNEGVDAASRFEYTTAAAAYQKALEFNPFLIQAANNLGYLLEQQHQFDEAVKVYQNTLKTSPDEPLLHRNLGVVYEKMGKIREAIEEYEAYLKLNSQSDPPIEAIVRNYRAHHRSQLSATSDYLRSVQQTDQGYRLVWSRDVNPIMVYLGVKRPQDAAFLEPVRHAYAQWEKATRGQLRFRETSNPNEANVLISFIDGALAHPEQEVGHAEYEIRRQRSGRRRHDMTVYITLKTGGPADQMLPLAQRQMYVHRFALHELGHAIGIWGHSTNPEDVMYAHPIVSDISSRDVNTLNRLYAVR